MAKKQQNTELEDLKALRTELETNVSAAQTELSQKDFPVDFESLSNINRVLKHLNDDVNWNTKNAALLVNLNDNLKVEKQRINAEVAAAKQAKKELEEGQESTVYLKPVDLNTLYQSLLGVNSTGIEAARNYIKLLTNIGAQISAAMQEMTEENKKIQALHAELGDLDKKILEFGIPVEQPVNVTEELTHEVIQ
jgi:hypothetical protein